MSQDYYDISVHIDEINRLSNKIRLGDNLEVITRIILGDINLHCFTDIVQESNKNSLPVAIDRVPFIESACQIIEVLKIIYALFVYDLRQIQKSCTYIISSYKEENPIQEQINERYEVILEKDLSDKDYIQKYVFDYISKELAFVDILRRQDMEKFVFNEEVKDQFLFYKDIFSAHMFVSNLTMNRINSMEGDNSDGTRTDF